MTGKAKNRDGHPMPPYGSEDYVTWRKGGGRSCPVLKSPPQYKPLISVTPFESAYLVSPLSTRGSLAKARRDLAAFFGTRPYTFFPRAMYAIYALFKWLSSEGMISRNGEVCIRTTTESPYISRCVTAPIGEVARWGRSINNRTQAIFVIHEFGFPHPGIRQLRQAASEKGIPLVEDCAYSWGWGGTGKYGDYVIYSAPKIFPVQFGGFLVGKRFERDYVARAFRCSDPGKEKLSLRALSIHLPLLGDIGKKRIGNYRYYQSMFGQGKTFFGALKKGVVPGAFVLKRRDEEEMKRVSESVRRFGIECNNYWKNSAVLLPVHQNLSREQLEYIAGSVCGAVGRP